MAHNDGKHNGWHNDGGNRHCKARQTRRADRYDESQGMTSSRTQNPASISIHLRPLHQKCDNDQPPDYFVVIGRGTCEPPQTDISLTPATGALVGSDASLICAALAWHSVASALVDFCASDHVFPRSWWLPLSQHASLVSRDDR